MQIEEFCEYAVLFDIYGKLLSNKQYEVMDKFLNLDLGESELAELLGESRQSVHDAVAKAKKHTNTNDCIDFITKESNRLVEER